MSPQSSMSFWKATASQGLTADLCQEVGSDQKSQVPGWGGGAEGPSVSPSPAPSSLLFVSWPPWCEQLSLHHALCVPFLCLSLLTMCRNS